jgi:pantoate--beta-alanine ligase
VFDDLSFGNPLLPIIARHCHLMIQIHHISELNTALASADINPGSLGFVPTMGALHAGHASLVRRAIRENDRVIASVFVNPTQFNNQSDLDKYPRTPEPDAALLEAAGCHIAFFPLVTEMIPTENYTIDNFGTLESVMEGEHRPGHFRGMAMIVNRFFELIKPDRAYFGEKDFQQLAIVREMNRRMHTGIEVIGCATVRETDGLAMSSRNVHLTPEEREQAPVIYESLVAAAEMIRDTTPKETAVMVRHAIEKTHLFRVQYIEFVDAHTLLPIAAWDPYHEQRACIAVTTSATRLIDNIAL